jgi:hypothetical protein
VLWLCLTLALLDHVIHRDGFGLTLGFYVVNVS